MTRFRMNVKCVLFQTNSAAFVKSSWRAAHRICASKMFIGQDKLPQGQEFASRSHKLLLYNNLMYPSHPGAFHLLPALQRAVDKLTCIIDVEMAAIGADKVALSTLTPARLWRQSGRWDDCKPELFILKDRHNTEFCLGPTHEEAITNMVARLNESAKLLPIKLYQITRKFRDEIRPSHGLLRCREFDMKDLYTFDKNNGAAEATYESVCQAYHNIFHRLGLNYYKVAAHSGNIGGSHSHEFHISSGVGQDTLYVCNSCHQGLNKEIVTDTTDLTCSQCKASLTQLPGIEIGHTFLLGTKYSAVFKAIHKSLDGKPKLCEMGCYGIGVTRLVAAAVEVLSKDEEIRWPLAIAPYLVSVITHKSQESAAQEFYDDLQTVPGLKNQVIFDDRCHRHSIAKMIWDAKKKGVPYIVVFRREGNEYEIVDVPNDTSDIVTDKQALLQTLQQKAQHIVSLQT